jgi:serine/threonine protein kinase
MECPDENTLVAMIEDGLDPADRDALDAHLDSCAACAALAIELAHVLTPDDPDGIPTPSIHQARHLEGGYVLGKILGQGGMGAVYEGRHETLGRRVAIKLLRADMADPAMRHVYTERLLREARLLASLSHPNIMTIFDVGIWREGQVFLAMELVEGDTLRGWLKAEARTWRQILDVYLQAARGLEAAHARGVIHRDVKPENMLIGLDGRVRVTDFGLARAGEQGVEEARTMGGVSMSSASNLTQTGDIMGTPAYMAPEQHLGADVDHRADQFALCVSLWEALVGERPFEGESRQALAMAVCAGQLRDAPQGIEVPRALLDVLRRGLRPVPAERWASMGALIEALEAAARPAPPVRWHQRLLALLLAAGLVLVMGVLAYREARRSAAPPGPAPTISEPRDPVLSELPPEPEPLALPPELPVIPAAQEVARAFTAARMAQEAAVGTLVSARPVHSAARVERRVWTEPGAYPEALRVPRALIGEEAPRDPNALAKLEQLAVDKLRYEQAAVAYEAAQQAERQRDGARCLREIERAESLVPTYKRALGALRGRCVMLTGDCERGKQLHMDSMRALPDSSRPTEEDIVQSALSVSKQLCPP